MLFRIFSKQLETQSEALVPGPERKCSRNILYLQLGQLSELLGSVKDELSALEETERQKKGRQAERKRERRGALLLSGQNNGGGKWLSVTQRTATFLTHTFINSHSEPLYRCHGTFSFKCCYHTYLSFNHSKTLHTNTTRRRESGSARSKGRKIDIFVHSNAHRHTHSPSLSHTHIFSSYKASPWCVLVFIGPA